MCRFSGQLFTKVGTSNPSLRHNIKMFIVGYEPSDRLIVKQKECHICGQSCQSIFMFQPPATDASSVAAIAVVVVFHGQTLKGLA